MTEVAVVVRGRVGRPLVALAGALLLAPGPVRALTLEVDTGNPSCSDTIGTPFCTIQGAVDNAAAGDEIEIAAGLYVESLVIDRDLTLRGAGISAVPGACDGETRLAGGPALSVPAGVTAVVRQVTILGSGAGQGGGVHNQGDLLIATSEVCQNFASVQGGGLYTEGRLVLSRVEVYDNTHMNFGVEGGGLFVQDGGIAVVDRSSFHGNRVTRGGAIAVAEGGALTLTRSTVANNFADNSSPSLLSGAGGGIYNAGWALVDQSEIGTGATGGNAVIDSSGTGGGIHNTGDLLVTRSTLAGNVIDMTDPAGAIALGAGLYNGGRAAVASSTVSGNSIHPVILGYGAGIYSNGTLSVSNATITDNANGGAGVTAGAGIDASNFTRIRNTIVAHQAIGDDCGAAVGSDGYNIDSDDTCGLISVALGGSDQPGVADAGLLPLADYGGPTRTHALAEDSPAVDAGDPAGCLADLNGNGVANVPVATDQRGNVLLEVEDALPDPSGCDVGAVELNMVTNAMMEDDDDGDRIPDGWTGSGLTAADRRYCIPRLAHEGRCYFLLRGDAATTKQLVQEVERAGSSGDRLTLSVFAGALDLTAAPRVVVQLDDLQTIGPGEEFELLLPTGSYAYQQLTLSVVATAPSGYDVVRIIVEAGSSGELAIDDVGLVPLP